MKILAFKVDSLDSSCPLPLPLALTTALSRSGTFCTSSCSRPARSALDLTHPFPLPIALGFISYTFVPLPLSVLSLLFQPWVLRHTLTILVPFELLPSIVRHIPHPVLAHVLANATLESKTHPTVRSNPCIFRVQAINFFSSALNSCHDKVRKTSCV